MLVDYARALRFRLMGLSMVAPLARLIEEYFNLVGPGVSIADFGGVSGSDNTAAFERAIESGEAIYIPRGYEAKLSHADLLNADLVITGGGWTSQITHTDPTQHLFTAKASNIKIRNVRLNGASSSEANGTFAIFTATADAPTGLDIENVYFTSKSAGLGFNNGIKFDGSCHYGRVSNCRIERLYGAAAGYGYGVLVGAADGVLIQNNHFFASSGRGRHAAYLSSGASYCEVSGNYIDSFTWQGINQNSTGGSPIAYQNVIEGNILKNCVLNNNTTSGAIGIYGHSLGAIIANNQIYNSGSHGIAVDVSGESDAISTTISGNKIRNSYNAGIDVLGANKVTIGVNEIIDSSQSGAGNYANIRLVRDATNTYATQNVTITGNTIPASATARAAVTVNGSAPAPTGIVFGSNNFGAGTVATIENSSNLAITLDGFTFYTGTWDPASIANGASTSQTFTATGAALGDHVIASCSAQLQGLVLYAEVSAADTVRIVLNNNTGSAQDIGNTNWRIWVRKKQF